VISAVCPEEGAGKVIPSVLSKKTPVRVILPIKPEEGTRLVIVTILAKERSARMIFFI